MSHPKQLTDPARALAFILAGKATVTFVSVKTGARFTYKVTEAKRKDGQRGPLPFFVKVLNGPDNTANYGYLGTIFERKTFRVTRKSHFNSLSPSARAFGWVLAALVRGELSDRLEVWHEGKCGACNRKLTVPESIERGLGPDCAKAAGLTRPSRRAKAKPAPMTAADALSEDGDGSERETNPQTLLGWMNEAAAAG